MPRPPRFATPALVFLNHLFHRAKQSLPDGHVVNADSCVTISQEINVSPLNLVWLTSRWSPSEWTRRLGCGSLAFGPPLEGRLLLRWTIVITLHIYSATILPAGERTPFP